MSQTPGRSSRAVERPRQDRLTGETAARPVETLIDDAQLAERQGRYSEARALYERALFQLRSPTDAPVAASLLRWIGLTYTYDANIGAALDCLEAALAVAEVCGDLAAVGQTINAQAVTYFRQGRLDDAERLYLEARESARRSGEAKLAAMTSQNLGVIANIRGELEQALWHYEASLAEYRALGLPKYICITLNNLGLLYTRMERWETAERAFEEAIGIVQVLGDLTTRIMLEVNLATLWIARADFLRAHEAATRALSLSQQTQDTQAAGEIHKCFGVIARETGDFVLAEESFERADRMAHERQDALLTGEVARELAELYRRQGRNRDTLQCLNRAHRIFSRLQARPDVADIDRQTTRLESDFLEVVRRWGESIESKDHYTQGHCQRVADLACALAEEAGLEPKALFWFRIGALLHDVGKLTIPPEVLNKPGRLTPEEWDLVKQHPVAGVQMLADIDFPWDVRPIVESHHERWDGGGYPHGLAGEEIPRTARILCLADVYDALTSERSYKRAVTHEQAMMVMRGEVGGQFDPALFTAFETVMSRRSTLVRQVDVVQPEPGPEVPVRDQQSDLDDLTGVPLRRAFIEHANAVLARRRANEPPPSLLVIDVDHFKIVNDTYGHLQGDDVLRSVVGVLKASLRTGDVIGRYGGDEFVVLLPRSGIDVARDIADRLRASVETEPITLRGKGGMSITVTLSIGVAAAQPDDHIEAVFAAADRALYDAKRAGRNAIAVAGTTAEAQRPQLHLNRFVGRVEEMRRLVRLLEDSGREEPHVVAIVGEAGVGKSTLVRQLLPEVRLRGGSLVIGRCLEADVKPPYGPWAEILDAIRQRVAPSDRVWRELSRLVPRLVTGSAPPSPDTPGSKYALYDEIVEFVREAARVHPLVILLDDMQWADSATWDTLEHLIPQLERDRVLICLTIRAEDKSAEVMDRRRRLSRDERFSELSLPRLTREELDQWLAAASHGQELGRELLPALYRHTEGNPFLVVQVLRALVEEGEIRYDGERWIWRQTSELRLPVAVSDLMARRLDRLSDRTRNILTTAAVIGRVFDIDLAIESGAGSEDDLLDAIDEAVSAAVLEPSRADGDQYSFAHTLLLDAIRRMANPRRLRRIHQGVAEALERRSPSAVAEIASHYDQAANASRAYEFAIKAAQASTLVYAHDEAVGFFQMAERHAQSEEQQLDTAIGLAQVAEASGRYGEALELCDRALAVAPASTPASVVLPIRRMRERLKGLLGQPLLQTREACYQLIADAEAAGIESERVALLTMISQTYSRLGDVAAAQALARESVGRAECIGDQRLLAEAAMRLGSTLLEAGLDEAIEQYRRAENIYGALDDRYGMVRCQINMGIVYSNAGNSAEAESAYSRAVELGEAAHAPDLAGLASLNLGVLYLKEGRYEEAREWFEQARRLFTTVKNEPHRLATLYNLGHLTRECGNVTAALELYEETASLARRIGQLDVEIGALAGAGLAGAALGRHEYARNAVLRADALIGQRADPWFQGRELAEALAVRVAIQEGRRHYAERRFYDALALAEQRDRYGAAWLVAEAGASLARAGLASLWYLIERYAAQVHQLGYAPLSERYAALIASRRTAQAS